MNAAHLTEVEQEELEVFIQKKTSWGSIPERAKKLVGNSEQAWRTYVLRHSIQHQLRWRTNMVREIVNSEKSYYEDLVKWSREHFMVILVGQTFTLTFLDASQLYPYHLADVLVKGLRLTPFKYYLDMMADVMKSGE